MLCKKYFIDSKKQPSLTTCMSRDKFFDKILQHTVMDSFKAKVNIESLIILSVAYLNQLTSSVNIRS